MPKTALRYELYLPLTYNNGNPVEDEKFNAVEEHLLERFRGLTSHQREFPLRGIWQGDTRLFLDEVIFITILDFRPRGSTRFISQLKKKLLGEFDQLEILITETKIRVH